MRVDERGKRFQIVVVPVFIAKIQCPSQSRVAMKPEPDIEVIVKLVTEYFFCKFLLDWQ
jgi:hypothetical protein